MFLLSRSFKPAVMFRGTGGDSSTDIDCEADERCCVELELGGSAPAVDVARPAAELVWPVVEFAGSVVEDD